MKKPARIVDIAQKLDLNLSTVSKALNNKPGVSDKTRKLIVETAKEMGYRPNDLARGLALRSTNTIGVIIPEIINPIFGEIFTGIIETAEQMNFDVFLSISNWDEKRKGKNILTLQQKRVDGIIVDAFNSVNQKLLEETNIPIVVFESWSERHKFTTVNTNNRKGGYIAARHLIDCGYKKTVCLLGPSKLGTTQQRLLGVLQAFEEDEKAYDQSLIYYGEYNLNSGYKLAEKAFSEHSEMDSIFAGNDVMAFGIMEYLSKQKIVPGKDCGLIGFDNINFSGMNQFKLTTIKQPKYSLGRIMTKVLIDEILNQRNGASYYAQKIQLEPELIVRETTCKVC